jgi:hypothetical protein
MLKKCLIRRAIIFDEVVKSRTPAKRRHAGLPGMASLLKHIIINIPAKVAAPVIASFLRTFFFLHRPRQSQKQGRKIIRHYCLPKGHGNRAPTLTPDI